MFYKKMLLFIAVVVLFSSCMPNSKDVPPITTATSNSESVESGGIDDWDFLVEEIADISSLSSCQIMMSELVSNHRAFLLVHKDNAYQIVMLDMPSDEIVFTADAPDMMAYCSDGVFVFSKENEQVEFDPERLELKRYDVPVAQRYWTNAEKDTYFVEGNQEFFFWEQEQSLPVEEMESLEVLGFVNRDTVAYIRKESLAKPVGIGFVSPQQESFTQSYDNEVAYKNGRGVVFANRYTSPADREKF